MPQHKSEFPLPSLKDLVRPDEHKTLMERLRYENISTLNDAIAVSEKYTNACLEYIADRQERGLICSASEIRSMKIGEENGDNS